MTKRIVRLFVLISSLGVGFSTYGQAKFPEPEKETVPPASILCSGKVPKNTCYMVTKNLQLYQSQSRFLRRIEFIITDSETISQEAHRLHALFEAAAKDAPAEQMNSKKQQIVCPFLEQRGVIVELEKTKPFLSVSRVYISSQLFERVAVSKDLTSATVTEGSYDSANAGIVLGYIYGFVEGLHLGSWNQLAMDPTNRLYIDDEHGQVIVIKDNK